jgi:predicted nucleotide-binding protein
VTGGSDAEESATLDQKFLEKFVAAVQGGRCSLWAFRQGELTPTMIDSKLITVASLRLS